MGRGDVSWRGACCRWGGWAWRMIRATLAVCASFTACRCQAGILALCTLIPSSSSATTASVPDIGTGRVADGLDRRCDIPSWRVACARYTFHASGATCACTACFSAPSTSATSSGEQNEHGAGCALSMRVRLFLLLTTPPTLRASARLTHAPTLSYRAHMAPPRLLPGMTRGRRDKLLAGDHHPVIHIRSSLVGRLYARATVPAAFPSYHLPACNTSLPLRQNAFEGGGARLPHASVQYISRDHGVPADRLSQLKA